MAWVKIDDQFADHPKTVEAGPLAMAMQIAALCWANRKLTDGYIPSRAAASFLPTVGFDPETGEPTTWRDVVDTLVRVGMWEPVEGGYLIHDYLDYQPSRARVKDIKTKRKEAGSKGGQATAQQSAKQIAEQPESKEPANEQQNMHPVTRYPLPVPNTQTNKQTAPEDPKGVRPSDPVVEAWHERVGMMGPAAFEKLQAWVDQNGMERGAVAYGIEVAADAKEQEKPGRKPSVAFVDGILRNWHNDGVRTLEDAREAQRARASPKNANDDAISAARKRMKGA